MCAAGEESSSSSLAQPPTQFYKPAPGGSVKKGETFCPLPEVSSWKFPVVAMESEFRAPQPKTSSGGQAKDVPLLGKYKRIGYNACFCCVRSNFKGFTWHWFVTKSLWPVFKGTYLWVSTRR